MAGVIHPEIIGIEDADVGGTCLSHGKVAPRGERMVGSGGWGRDLYLCNISNHFIRGSDETVRSLVPYYEEICGKGSSIRYPFRYAQNRFERHTRFLNKQAEQSIAVSQAATVARMSDEASSYSP
jgi:hypothetical protein